MLIVLSTEKKRGMIIAINRCLLIGVKFLKAIFYLVKVVFFPSNAKLYTHMFGFSP